MLLLFGTVAAFGQSADDEDPVARASAARAQVTAIEGRDELADAERESAAGLARAAADAWDSAANEKKQTKEQAAFVAAAPGRIATARAAADALASGGSRPPADVGPFDTPAAADAALREAEAARSRAKAAVGEAEAKQAAANSRMATLGVELDQARAAERVALDATDPPTDPETDADSALFRPLRADLTAARRTAARQQVLLLEQIELALPLRADLAAAERRLAEQRSTVADAQVQALTARVTVLRRAEARAAEDQAAAGVAAAGALPDPFPQWAQRTVELARLAGHAAADESRLRAVATQSAAAEAELSQSLTLAQERVAAGEMTEAVSKLFTAERLSLPSEARLGLELEGRQEELSELSTQSIDLRDERRHLTRDGPIALNQVPEQQKEAARAVIDQMSDRLDDALKAVAGVLDAASAAVDADDQQLKSLSAYSAFLDARLLWTPDLKSLRPDDGPAAVRDVTRWLNQLDKSEELAGLGRAAQRTPVSVMLLAGLGVLQLAFRRRLKRAVEAWHEPVGRLAADRFGYTVKAFTALVVIACTPPILLLALGLSLRSVNDVALVRALGSAVTALAVILVPLLILRNIARPCGLAVKHFEWPENACLAMRNALRGLIPLLAGTSLVVTFIGAEPGGDAVDLRGVGRLVLIATMLAVSVYVGALLRKRGPLAAAIMHSGGTIGRSHWLWYPLVLAAPVTVAVLAARGYYYTALRLESRLLGTVLLGTALLIVYAMALRCLRLAHRKLSYAELVRKREAARQAREEAEAKAKADAEARRRSRRGVHPGGGVRSARGDRSRRAHHPVCPQRADRQADQQRRGGGLGVRPVGRVARRAAGAGHSQYDPGAGPEPAGAGGRRRLDFRVSLAGRTGAQHHSAVADVHRGPAAARFDRPGGSAPFWSAAGYPPRRHPAHSVRRGGGGAQRCVFGHRVRLVAHPVAARGPVGGPGLRPAGNLRQLRQRADHFVRASRPAGRYGHGGRHHGDGHQDPHPRHHHHRPESARADRAQQRVHHQLVGELVAEHPGHADDRAGGHRLRVRHPAGPEAAARDRGEEQVGADHARVLGPVFGVRDNTLNFELRVFITDVLRRFPIMSDLHLAIDDAFRAANISIAFPQRDVHLDQIGPLEVTITDKTPPAPRSNAATA